MAVSNATSTFFIREKSSSPVLSAKVHGTTAKETLLRLHTTSLCEADWSPCSGLPSTECCCDMSMTARATSISWPMCTTLPHGWDSWVHHQIRVIALDFNFVPMDFKHIQVKIVRGVWSHINSRFFRYLRQFVGTRNTWLRPCFFRKISKAIHKKNTLTLWPNMILRSCGIKV